MIEIRETESGKERNIIEYELKRIRRESDEIGLLSVRGIWPTGSDGNNDAQILASKIAGIVKNETISKIVLDLTELNYRCGNSFLEFAISAIKQNRNFEYVIIANGETEKSLISLLEFSGLIFGFKGIYQDKNEGIKNI